MLIVWYFGLQLKTAAKFAFLISVTLETMMKSTVHFSSDRSVVQMLAWQQLEI